MVVYFITFVVAVSLASFASLRVNQAKGEAGFPRRFALTPLLVAVLLVAVSALRWQVGTDYNAYARSFPRYVREAENGLTEEVGIRWIAWLAHQLNGDNATMLGLAAMLTVGLIVWTLWRWSPSFSFAIAIYVLSGAWHGSFNTVRQYIACAILFAGHRYIVDRRPVMWLLVVLAATLFHTSAVFGIFLYFVPRRRLRVHHQIAVILLAALVLNGTELLLENMGTLSGSPEQGTSEYAAQQVNVWRVAFAFVPVVLYWLVPNSSAIQRGNGWFYVNMLVVYASVMLATSGSVYLARFAIYPQIFLGISISYVTQYAKSADRLFVRAALLVMFGIFMYIEVSGSADLREFQWIFNRPS